MIFEIQNEVSRIYLVELEQETHIPSKNLAYVIISDLFQDVVQIKNSCFWEMKVNCARAGLTYFLGNKVTPTYTPITIIPLDFVSRTVGT